MNSCPFCGGRNISIGEVLGERTDGSRYTQSECLSCGAEGPKVEGWNRPNTAATAWDTRADPGGPRPAVIR